MKSSLLFFFLAVLVAGPHHALAQSISGTVTEKGTGNPLPGVNILIGVFQGAATDVAGKYEIT